MPLPSLVPLICALVLALPSASRLAFAQSPSMIAPSRSQWIVRARELEKHGDWSRLLEWGRLWTTAESDNALAWFVLGRAYRGLNRYPEAIGAYQQNLRIEPGDVHARNNLGNAG